MVHLTGEWGEFIVMTFVLSELWNERRRCLVKITKVTYQSRRRHYSEGMLLKKRSFGVDQAEVSELGFGAGGFWGMSVFDEEVAKSLVDLALDLGFTLFDTGPNYSNANAEVRLGRILGRRVSDVFIGTKGGTHYRGGKHVKDYSYSGLQASFEESLRRLGRDYIDLYQLHDMPDFFSDETLRFITDLKASGKAKHLGVSTDSWGANTALTMNVFDVIMIEYNILERALAEATIAEARSANVGVMVKSPLAKTLYSKDIFKVRSLSDLWYLVRAYKNNRHKIAYGKKFRFIPDHATPLQFVLANDGVTSAITGTINPAHLRANALAAETTIDPDLMLRIRAVSEGQDDPWEGFSRR